MSLMKICFLCITVLPLAIRSDNFIYTGNYSVSYQVLSQLTPIVVRSRIHCATVCSIDLTCRGFYYVEMSRECFPELSTSSTVSIFSDNGANLVHEGQYYLKNPAPVNGTAPSPTLVCPDRFTGKVVLEGTAGNVYNFTMLNAVGNQSESVALCDARGLRMLTLNDEAKIDTLVSFLRDLHLCTGYNATGYWTDALEHTATNGTEWRNSEGAVLGLSIWCSTAIGFDAMEHCARLSRTCAYKLRDIECSHQGFSVICE